MGAFTFLYYQFLTYVHLNLKISRFVWENFPLKKFQKWGENLYFCASKLVFK